MDHEKILNLGAEMGRSLMSSGAEIYRVEESVHRLLTAYGFEPQVFAIPKMVLVSVTTPEGHPITRMCRVSSCSTNIELLEQYNALCRQLCREVPSVDEAMEQLTALGKTTRVYSAWQQVGGYTATAAFFTLFFGGGIAEFLCAALCGFAVGMCLMFGQRLTGTNMFFRTVVCSALLACLAWVLGAGLQANTDHIAIGTLMVLVPGMALTNAMREIMAGDIFSGLHRTAEVILVATAIALGTALPVVLERLL